MYVKQERIDHLGNRYSTLTEMLNKYNISRSVFHNRINTGWSLEDALTKPTHSRATETNKCTDHLGNEYASLTKMAETYGLAVSMLRNRLKLGWSLEDALTKPKQIDNSNRGKIEPIDHLGNKYLSIREMTEYYGIQEATFIRRIRNGMTVKEALSAPLMKKRKKSQITVKDHLGNKYISVSDMCKNYKITTSNYYGRLLAGWTLEKILTTPTKKHIIVKDHLGNEYQTIADMCRQYGITEGQYRKRIKNGMSLEEALCHTPFEVKDHHGKIFKSIKEMCAYYDIRDDVYRSRLKRGLSQEEALAGERVKRGSIVNKTDHLGEVYPSQKEMLQKYGISYQSYVYRVKNGWSKEKALTTPFSNPRLKPWDCKRKNRE